MKTKRHSQRATQERRGEAEPAIQEANLGIEKLQNKSQQMDFTEAFYRGVMNNLRDGVAILMNNGKVIANRAFFEIHGLRRSVHEPDGSWYDLIHEDDRDAVRVKASSWIRGDAKVTSFEYRIIRPDGQLRTLEATPAVVACRGIRRTVVIVSDISELKAAEKKVQYLASQPQEETVAYRTLARDIEIMGQAVCHDLKAPLVVIEWFRQKLLQEYGPALGEGFAEPIDAIGKNARWMNRLIDGLADYTGIVTREISRETVSVQEIVSSAIRDVSLMHQGRRIALDLKALPAAYGDETMLRRAFTNLISNAFKFTKYKESAVIEVGFIEKPDEIIYYVKDNGEGFHAQSREDLFVPFGRLHHVHTFEGTGIGLAIVKRVADLHGGRVWAVGKVGEGAIFYLALPRNHKRGQTS